MYVDKGVQQLEKAKVSQKSARKVPSPRAKFFSWLSPLDKADDGMSGSASVSTQGRLRARQDSAQAPHAPPLRPRARPGTRGCSAR